MMTLSERMREFNEWQALTGDIPPFEEWADIVAALESQNAALLEALELCECELTLYVGLAEQSNNPQAWHDAITAAREAIRRHKGGSNE